MSKRSSAHLPSEVKVRVGTHAALVYSDPAQLSAAVGFLAEGAQSSERCAVLAYSRLNERIDAQLRDLHGLPVRRLQAAGQLAFLGAQETGKQLKAQLKSFFSKGRPKKPGRLVVSLGWGEQSWPGDGELLWLDSQLDSLCREELLACLCLYDARQLGGNLLLHGALECHQTVITRGLPHQNPFALPAATVAREQLARQKAERSLRSWIS